MIDYSKILNKSVLEIAPSGIRKFFDIAEKMDNVISLGVGEPDFPTPWHIRNAGIRSLELSKTRYTSNSGLLELRKEISKFLNRKYNVDYCPENEILISVGGSEAIDACIRAIVSPGDEVIIPEPSFVCYKPITIMAGGIPVVVNTDIKDNFKLTAEQLKRAITPKTKAIVLPFPSNPTGSILEREDLEQLADVVRGTNIIVIADEIYAELTYGSKHHVSIASIDSMKERTVLINGFSKAYSMTGWRLGFACGPEKIIKQMTKIHQFAIMSSPTTSQYAAIEAIKNGDKDIADMLEQYDDRRKIIVNGFNKIGLTCHEPFGAFYAFPSIKKSGLSSEEFCEKLLISKKVALVPGTAFGESGEGFVRASYCYSVEHINEAQNRIEEFMKEIDG